MLRRQRNRPTPAWVVSIRDSGPGQVGGRVVRIMVNRRVMGLAAEGAFWIVFSLPWLMLGAVGIISTIDELFPMDTVTAMQQDILAVANDLLSQEVVDQYVKPLVDGIFVQGAADLSIVSFLVALWSGSRGIQTFVETNMIVNGQFRRRGYVVTRLISIALLIAVALLVAISVPLLTAGPRIVGTWFDVPSWLVSLVWGTLAILLGMAVLTGVLHFSLPKRPKLYTSIPGAVIIVVGWWAGSYALGYYVQRLFQNTSIYGVLAAPIAIMVYAFLISAVAFVAATFNAALRGCDAPAELQEGAVALAEPATS